MIIDPNNGFNMVRIDSGRDCKDLVDLFRELKGDFLRNPKTSDQIRHLLESHPDRPLIICGHGSPLGVLNRNRDGYILDKSFQPLLQQLPCVIGIWCYAGNFADAYDIKGFFTSMFVSNFTESLECGVKAHPEDLRSENQVFAKRMNWLLRNEPDVSKWTGWMQAIMEGETRPFVLYNYEGLTYYE